MLLAGVLEGGELYFGGESTSPGGALSMKEERAAVRDIAAIWLCSRGRVCFCGCLNCLARRGVAGGRRGAQPLSGARASRANRGQTSMCPYSIAEDATSTAVHADDVRITFTILKLEIDNGYLYISSNHRWPH